MQTILVVLIPLKITRFLIVDVLEVRKIRAGWQTDVFKRFSRQDNKKSSKDADRPRCLKESHCFSIIYGSQNKSVDLVANDDKTAAAWVQGLQSLLDFVQTLPSPKEDSM